MTCDEAIDHLKDLKMLRTVYSRLVKDPKTSLYDDCQLEHLIQKTTNEINRIIELMMDMELADSYDQNTGEMHQIYRTMSAREHLNKLCGGPKSE